MSGRTWSAAVYQNYENANNACTNNSTFTGLAMGYPYNEQMAQFAVYSGPGVAYASAATTNTTLTLEALPTGSTILAAYLIQSQGYTHWTCCGLGTESVIDGAESFSGDGEFNGGVPPAAAATFNGNAYTGTVTGFGTYVDIYEQPYWGPDGDDNWIQGEYTTRFNVTAGVAAAGGSYSVTVPAGDTVPGMSTLFIVYSAPQPSCGGWEGVVALADGAYAWHAQADDEPDENLVHYGTRPLPTLLNWSCTGYAICDPSSAQFTVSGEDGLGVNSDSDYAYQIVANSSTATQTTATTALWTSAAGVLDNAPVLDTYVDPAGGFTVGESEFTWDLGGETLAESSYLVDGLAVSFECPLVCTATATATVTAATSAGFSIFRALATPNPNPVSIALNLQGQVDGVRGTLFSTSRLAVRQFQWGPRPGGWNSLPLDTRGLPNGLYYLRLQAIRNGVLSPPVAAKVDVLR